MEVEFEEEEVEESLFTTIASQLWEEVIPRCIWWDGWA